MIKKILCFYFLIIISLNANSCTTFILKSSNQLVFGRNLDWVSDNGIIVVNKRNIRKSSVVLPTEKSIHWISKFGSITFNQFGKEFPYGGINEKGLVIEIMLADAQYPLPDSRPAINELQWIQYQLDNASSIEEVINSDKLLRISQINQELHFLICDSAGKVAVIEFANNKMVVYKDKDLPISVLENASYANSLESYKNNASCRFTKATNLIKNYKEDKYKSIVDYSFSVLDSVILNGSWSIVYDIKNMQIHFKTASNKDIRTININAFDFDCENQNMIYDLKLKNKGNINNYFATFNSKLNTEKMNEAIETNEIDLPNEILLKFQESSNEYKCVK